LSGHGRQQDAIDLNKRRTQQYAQQRWKDTEGQGEQHFQRDLRGQLLGLHSPPRPQFIREYAQRIADACAEAICLHQHRDERIDLVDTSSQCKIAQCLLARAACAQLEIDEMKFLGKNLAARPDFFGDLDQRCV